MVLSSRTKSFIRRCSSVSLSSMRKNLLKRVSIPGPDLDQQDQSFTYIIDLKDPHIAPQSPLSPESMESFTKDIYDLNSDTDLTFTLRPRQPDTSGSNGPQSEIQMNRGLSWDLSNTQSDYLTLPANPQPKPRRISKRDMEAESPRKGGTNSSFEATPKVITVKVRLHPSKRDGAYNRLARLEAQSVKSRSVTYDTNQSTGKVGREDIYTLRQYRPQPRPRPKSCYTI